MVPHAPTSVPEQIAPIVDAPSGPPPPDPSTRRPDDLGRHGMPPMGPPRNPPPPPRPPKPRPNLYRPVTLAVVVATAFAVGTPGAPVRSIGWAIALSVLVGALVGTAARRPAAIALGVAGAAFIPWLGVRMSPWLTSINLIAATGLLIASLGLPAAGSLRVTVAHHLARIARAVGGLPYGPSRFTHSARGAVTPGSVGRVRRVLPAMSVGLATLVVSLAVLASGDALLASFFEFGDLFGTAVVRVIAALCGAGLFAIMVGAIHAPGSTDAAPSMRSAPALPTLFGIGGLAIAIGTHAATQISAAVLGADFVKARTGLTYAEYARSGFFQMVAIALVAVAAIGAARSVLRSAPDAAPKLRIGAAAMTVGVIVTVVSAVVKLSVYADTFGLTMLRVYTVVFACWLGLLAVLAFAALLRRSASWFAPVLLGSMCIGAFAMNLVNPERIVAEHNLDRAASTGKLDVDYLDSLSLDAAPTILSRLDSIDAVHERSTRNRVESADAAELLELSWCARVLPLGRDASGELADTGLAYNASRRAALDSALANCT